MPPKGQVQDMERVSVQLTADAKREILEWASEAHLKPGYFMSLALTLGARALARQLNPEQFMTPHVWEAVMRGIVANPEMMAQLGDAGDRIQEALDNPERMKEVQARLVEGEP